MKTLNLNEMKLVAGGKTIKTQEGCDKYYGKSQSQKQVCKLDVLRKGSHDTGTQRPGWPRG